MTLYPARALRFLKVGRDLPETEPRILVATLAFTIVLAAGSRAHAAQQGLADLPLQWWAAGTIAFFTALFGLILAMRRRRRVARTERRDAARRAAADRAAAIGLETGRAGAFAISGAEFVASPGLAALLGLPEGQAPAPTDVAPIFDAQGGQDFDSAMARLREHGTAFTLTLRGADGKRFFRALGRRHEGAGTALDAVWLQDATETVALLMARERELARVRGMIDAVPVPIWARDAALKLVDCNAAYVQAVEAPGRGTVLRENRELAESTAANETRSLAKAALAGGAAQTRQQHIVVEGTRRLFAITETPLAGAVTAGHALDVTHVEEQRAAAARHAAAQNEVLERLAVAIVTVGPDGGVRFFNGAFARLWGLNETWLEAKPHLSEMLERLREQRMLPETGDFAAFRRQWLGWITGLIEPRQELLHLPNGMAIWMVVSPHPLGGLLFTFENVTYRLALERSVNTLAAVQRDTLDHLFDGVAVFGEDGVLKLSNPVFRTMWNLPEGFTSNGPHIGAVLDQARTMFPAAMQWDVLKARIMARVTNRRPRSGRLRRPDGGVVTYALVPLPDGGLLASFRDITDTVRVARALRERAEALEAADRIKAEFIANISYELRTPLNAIIGFAEILNNQYFGALNQRQGEYTAGILEASQRLHALINDILDLAVIEAGRMVLEIEPVAIKSLIDGVIQLTGEWAREQGLTLEVDCPASTGLIEADERRIKHVLFNLVSNAVKFTPPGGRITASARRVGAELALTVEDTGMGIPDEERDRVFEKFVRGRTSDGRFPGAGLGLALVKSLIELHGGRIELSSTAGKGTKVTCWLPVKSKVQPLAPVKAPPVTPALEGRRAA